MTCAAFFPNSLIFNVLLVASVVELPGTSFVPAAGCPFLMSRPCRVSVLELAYTPCLFAESAGGCHRFDVLFARCVTEYWLDALHTAALPAALTLLIPTHFLFSSSLRHREELHS